MSGFASTTDLAEKISRSRSLALDSTATLPRATLIPALSSAMTAFLSWMLRRLRAWRRMSSPASGP